MAAKPNLLLDPYWRRIDELFAPQSLGGLHELCNVVWAKDRPMPPSLFQDALPYAEILVTTAPLLTPEVLDHAKQLRMVIEVEGAFPDTVDYAACAKRGIEVLCCAPGFRQSVAEMGLAMALAGARGLVEEHTAMRQGGEHWLDDQPDRDFTMFGAQVGFVGFGQIAQELTRLLAPFRVQVLAYDPWLPQAVAQQHGAQLMGLDGVLEKAKCLFVTAVPTAENHNLLDEAKLSLMPKGALLVLLSRAHLVDFHALSNALKAGRIRAALDVFPTEPVAADDDIRNLPGTILSPHRAAAVTGGRHLIGDMILDDIKSWISGNPKRRLTSASDSKIKLLAGVGDAKSTQDLAASRS